MATNGRRRFQRLRTEGTTRAGMADERALPLQPLDEILLAREDHIGAVEWAADGVEQDLQRIDVLSFERKPIQDLRVVLQPHTDSRNRPHARDHFVTAQAKTLLSIISMSSRSKSWSSSSS